MGLDDNPEKPSHSRGSQIVSRISSARSKPPQRNPLPRPPIPLPHQQIHLRTNIRDMYMIRQILQSMQHMLCLHLHPPVRGAKLQREVFAELVEGNVVWDMVRVFVGGGYLEEGVSDQVVGCWGVEGVRGDAFEVGADVVDAGRGGETVVGLGGRWMDGGTFVGSVKEVRASSTIS